MIDGALLRNKNISPNSKLIIAFLYNLCKSGRCYFGSYEYMADQLGINYESFAKSIANLLEKKVIVQTSEGITLGKDFHYLSNLAPSGVADERNSKEISENVGEFINKFGSERGK